MKYNFEQIVKHICTLVLATVIIWTGIQSTTIDSKAGSSNIVIDKASFEKELDISKWNVPNEDVAVKDGKLVFSKESTEDTKIITMRAAKANPYSSELFRAEYMINIKELPKKKKFVAGFSLAEIESYVAEPESLNIVFENNDGIKISVLYYDENGNEKALVKSKNCNIREDLSFDMSVTATNDMHLSIKINNQLIYNQKASIDLAGRVGFLQTGSCEVEISDLNIVYNEYERPENANVQENFENGTFNNNLLTSKMISNAKSYPNGIQVEDYKGSKVLMFRSVAMGYFGTKYTYSNFEISFDVPFMQHKAELSEEGQILAMQNSAFVVGIGDDSSDFSKQHGYLSSAEGIVFNTTQVASLNNIIPPVKLAEKNYFDMDKNEGYSVKISVIDAKVTVYLKALKDSKYDKIMEYKLGDATPTGYIHFFANGQTNFAIDNLKIVNKDQDANLLDIEYKEGFIKGTEDWEYKQAEPMYLERNENEHKFYMAYIPLAACMVGIFMIVISFLVSKKREVTVMKNSIVKRFGVILLMGSLMCVSTACDKQKVTIEPMEIEDAPSLSFDILGGEDVMPIAGYNGPSAQGYSVNGQSRPDYYTDELFQAVADCGINMFTYSSTDYVYYPKQVKKMLELGEEYNIGITVTDTKISSPTVEESISEDDMAARIAKYCDYPAFCGVYVIDEPGSKYYKASENQVKDITTYAPVFEKLNKLDVWGYGNLYPVWNPVDYEKYEQMVAEYCETCSPSYLSWDYYLWDEGRTIEGYFYNMDLIRRYAEQYEIPFWCFIQAGGQWNDAKQYFDSGELYPTEGQMRWNVHTSLAYGAKGVQYFPVLQPSYFAYAETELLDLQRNGILGAWGNKTQWWHYAKAINKQIAAVDEVLMNSFNVGVIVTGAKAKSDTEGLQFVMKDTAWRELASVDGNTMIGCFNYNGKSALYVVNYETEYAQIVTLNLHDSYKLNVIQEAENSRIETDTVKLDLQAGEGVLLVFE